MAFNDMQIELYDGTRLLTYKDKAHRYYVQEKAPDGGWGSKKSVKGVTTIKDGTLEKKGLTTWPMGMALGELFGFYNFKNEKGEQMLGFSKDKGTLWKAFGSITNLIDAPDELKTALVPYIKSASEAWQRKKKTGADIGSLVHAAVEQYIGSNPFDLSLERYKQDQVFETPAEEHEWNKKAPEEIVQANLAFNQFKKWWDTQKPELLASEFLVYSKELNYAGTTDIRMKLNGKTVIADIKTSNASSNSQAAAPQGVYYDYFVQLGAYCRAWQEMTGEVIDDLLVISCRKDGALNTVLASDLGLTVADCTQWWGSVLECYKYMDSSKKALVGLRKAQDA